MLVNLITNAIDSMSDIGGSRVLSVKSQIQDDGDVRISIADTGAGIGPQDIDRIFDPLFTTKTNGMGMGLAICRSIIEAHDGRLWAAPNTPRGTVFHFCSAQSHTETFRGPEGQRPTGGGAPSPRATALPSGAT